MDEMNAYHRMACYSFPKKEVGRLELTIYKTSPDAACFSDSS